MRLYTCMYRVWVSRFTTVVVGVSKTGEKTVERLTLCMCDFVETERNALFMECFTNQVPSSGGNVVVFFPKDLNIYAPSSVGFVLILNLCEVKGSLSFPLTPTSYRKRERERKNLTMTNSLRISPALSRLSSFFP